MFILQRYIGISVVRGFFLLALIIVSLFSIILLIDELDQVGTGSYTWWLAIKYVFYHMPKILLDFAAFISLVGSIIALGSLASNHELIAAESVGVSPQDVVKAVLSAALLLMILVMMNAQFVIPVTLQSAYIEKTLAIEGQGEFVSESGYWAQNNHRFIHIRDVESGRIPIDVEIFEFNDQYELQQYYFAKKVLLTTNQSWELQNVTVKKLVDGKLEITTVDNLTWDSFLSTNQLNVIVSKPEALSISNLYHYVEGLKQRGEQFYRFELLFWQKVTTPISAAIMILLGMPFVFGSQRSMSVGKRITLGVLAGIAFYVVTQIITHTGTSLQWMPFLVAILPAILVFTLLVLIRCKAKYNYAC